MAETIVEKKVCEKCGSDVREGAVFCYHCGSSLETEVAIAANGEAVSSGWFRENITDKELKIDTKEKGKTTRKLDEKVVEKIDRPIAKPIDNAANLTTDVPIIKPLEDLEIKSKEEVVEVKEEAKPNNEESKKLKSAAELRKKNRLAQKKKVEEIIWEEHENAPNAWFLIVALVLILLAAVLFYLGIYMK